MGQPLRSVPRADLQFPVRFGRFVLIELLGEGGMGAVFRAEIEGPSDFRKTCALKVMHPGVAIAARRMGVDLKLEARIGALLHHPNVVEVYDFGFEEGQPWMAMEYVDGTELSDLLAGARALPPTALLDFGRDVCAGLAAAHGLTDGGRPLPVVHRDLKPSNLIVGRDGVVRIADFGVAKTAMFSSLATRSGVTKGTPSYMSPEQASAGPLDGRSDLFTLGGILFQAATGKRLFGAGNAAATVMEILKAEEVVARRQVRRRLDEIIDGLGGVVVRCLCRDPEERWPDAETLSAQLDELELRAPIGPSLPEWVKSLPDDGTAYRGVRDRRRRARRNAAGPQFDVAEHLPAARPMCASPPSEPEVDLKTWNLVPAAITGAVPVELRGVPQWHTVLALAIGIVMGAAVAWGFGSW